MAEARPPHDEPRKSAGGRVLLVDDEPAVLRAFSRGLRNAGHEVLTATNGKEAVDQVGRSAIDVIVSDISMPGMDGIQLLRAVRELDLDVPVVLITGAPDVATAVQALEYGAMQYLTKPIELSRLVAVVEKATRLHRVARMKREAMALHDGPIDPFGDRAGLEASFERALGSLWVAFQPIVRASNRSLFGYEALLRSLEPTLPHPGAVLDAAERLGRLRELGRRIRENVAQAASSLPGDEVLFVNLHARDLLDDELVRASSPLTALAGRVVLEITERASLEGITDVRPRVARLREMGFRIAIDDLGAGYAGLTSFAQLEPEFVKLDMTLVRDVPRSTTKQKLIRSLCGVCHEMGMMVVGEGVETRDERDMLVELGCDLLQGYLLARPGRAFPDFSWTQTSVARTA